MSIPKLINVTAFVDWNTQIFAAKPPKTASPAVTARKTLAYVGRSIGRLLYSLSTVDRYQVTLRIYHGWHKGFEITNRRKAIIEVAAGLDFVGLSDRPNVIFRAEMAFGDRLMSASNERLHARLNCHLPNTLRNSLVRPQEEEEKMVDTAIASDFVDLAHREPNRWLVLMAKDDDLVPPIFVAESIIGNQGGRVLLVRDRPDTPFLKLENLRFSP